MLSTISKQQHNVSKSSKVKCFQNNNMSMFIMCKSVETKTPCTYGDASVASFITRASSQSDKISLEHKEHNKLAVDKV